MQPSAGMTALVFHARSDHPDIRTKVFELLPALDFKFFAVIKDMRAVSRYVKDRNRMDLNYRYRPNELYDLTVRMLFKRQLHLSQRYRIVFARRGHGDRTETLRQELERTRLRFLSEIKKSHDPEIVIQPAYPREAPCLQVADYCLWALQRCYERGEARFLRAIWPKASLVHDVDDPHGRAYGRYLTRKHACPDPEEIKSR
jgi:hypothetical protein